MTGQAVGPVPFAWTDQDGILELVRGKVTQCALSRVCGSCGTALGRPVAFVGTSDEVGRNAFHAPPLHPACAEDVRRALYPAGEIVLTSGFEFVRPGKADLDPRPTFQPNSLLN